MQKHIEMFELSLELSITAPTEKKSKECIAMANQLASILPRDVVEKCKKKIERRLNGK